MTDYTIKTCHRKLRFETPLEAAEKAQKFWNENKKHVIIYRCDKCPMYHLATPKETKSWSFGLP